VQTRKRRRPTEPEEAVEDKHSERRKDVEIRRSNKNSDNEDARVEREAASGRLWEMRCQALLGAGPRFRLWKPRVFRLAPLKPGTALCTRMKRAQRQRPKRSSRWCCSRRIVSNADDQRAGG
jgi:hypothetical protein